MSYYTYKCKGVTLAPIFANSEEEAKKLLVVQHKWFDATPANSTLIKINGIGQSGIDWNK